MANEIEVEVAYARQRSQALLTVTGQPGLTARAAIERSGILQRYPEIDLQVNKVGIYGKLVPLDQVLTSGDRVEIYPPLIADPRQAKRKGRATTDPADTAEDDD